MTVLAPLLTRLNVRISLGSVGANGLGVEGGKALAAALRINKSITSLK